MATTITGTHTSAVTLTSGNSNPVTVISTAKLTPLSASYALYGEGGAGKTWTSPMPA